MGRLDLHEVIGCPLIGHVGGNLICPVPCIADIRPKLKGGGGGGGGGAPALGANPGLFIAGHLIPVNQWKAT